MHVSFPMPHFNDIYLWYVKLSTKQTLQHIYDVHKPCLDVYVKLSTKQTLQHIYDVHKPCLDVLEPPSSIPWLVISAIVLATMVVSIYVFRVQLQHTYNHRHRVLYLICKYFAYFCSSLLCWTQEQFNIEHCRRNAIFHLYIVKKREYLGTHRYPFSHKRKKNRHLRKIPESQLTRVKGSNPSGGAFHPKLWPMKLDFVPYIPVDTIPYVPMSYDIMVHGISHVVLLQAGPQGRS